MNAGNDELGKIDKLKLTGYQWSISGNKGKRPQKSEPGTVNRTELQEGKKKLKQLID